LRVAAIRYWPAFTVDNKVILWYYNVTRMVNLGVK